MQLDGLKIIKWRLVQGRSRLDRSLSLFSFCVLFFIVFVCGGTYGWAVKQNGPKRLERADTKDTRWTHEQQIKHACRSIFINSSCVSDSGDHHLTAKTNRAARRHLVYRKINRTPQYAPWRSIRDERREYVICWRQSLRFMTSWLLTIVCLFFFLVFLPFFFYYKSKTKSSRKGHKV